MSDNTTTEQTADAVSKVSTVPHDINSDIAKILQDIKLPTHNDENARKHPHVIAIMPTEADVMHEIITPSNPNTDNATNKPPEPLSTVHTLKDDLQHTIVSTGMTIVRATAMEQDNQRHIEAQNHVPSAKHPNNTSLYIAIISLIIIGCAAIATIFITTSGNKTVPVPTDTSIIFTERNTEISIDNLSSVSLKNQLGALINNSSGSLGSMERITPIIPYQNAPTEASAGEFIKAIAPNVPDKLARALDTRYFVGVHILDTNAPVFVFLIKDYENAFAGMLEWESEINIDLSPPFMPVPSSIDINGVPAKRLFRDSILRNFDIRVLVDDDGAPVMYYIFPNRTTLIIAASPYSFAEVMGRIQARNKQQ